MIACNCTVKENINTTLLNFNFSEPISQIKNEDYEMIKCVDLFTSIGDNLSNIGFLIFSLLMIINIVLLILYCLSLKNIKYYISKEMTTHGYVNKHDEGHTFCHNYIKKLDKLMERLNKMKKEFISKKGKGSAPPIKKTHTINMSEQSSKTMIMNKSKKIKFAKSSKDLENNIQRVKSKMAKTIKSKKTSIISFSKSSRKSLIETDGIKTENSQINTKDNNKENFKLNLIDINVDDLNKNINIPNTSKYILNIYNYEEAIKYDKRSFFQIYYIFLIAKQVIMHAFFFKSPIEPLPIRLSLLKFMLGCDLALNAIFYKDSKITEKYNSTKNVFVFGFTNNITAILLSTLIGYILFVFLGLLNNSMNAIRKIFKDEENKLRKNKNYKVTLLRKKEIIIQIKRIMKCFNIKIIIFYIIEFVCMIFFWYYVTIFCRLYKKTVTSWLIDCLITIIIRIILDLLLNILLSLLYSLAISIKNNCLYRTIIFLYCFS